MYRHKAHYSLDCGNGIEKAAVFRTATPEDIFEEKQFQEQVYATVMKLPEKQAMLKKTDIEPMVIEAIREIVRNEEYAKASQSGYSQSASLLAHNRIAASQLIRLNASFRMPFVPSYSDAAP